MARQGINTGITPNDGTGDSLLSGAIKINDNFSEIYSTLGDGNNLFTGIVTSGNLVGYATTGYVDEAISNISVFDQDLNTTNDVTFNRIGITTGEITVGLNNDLVITMVGPGGPSPYTFGIDGSLTFLNNVTIKPSIYNPSSLEFTAVAGGWVGLANSTGTYSLTVSDSEVTILSGGDKIWRFKPDATLTAPGDIIISSGGVGVGTTVASSALTIEGDGRFSGVVTATQFIGDGSGITGVVATGSGVEIRDDNSIVGTASTINFGDNLSVSYSSGIATITGAAGGGEESYWVSTSAGIHTLSNVGIGTTNPPADLSVYGDVFVSGFSTFTNNVYIKDSRAAIFGDNAELQIFNDGLNSYIDNFSTNNLVIRDDGIGIQFRRYAGSPSAGLMAAFNVDAGVELYYNSVLKLQTFQNGVAINDSIGIGSTAGNPPYRLTVSGVGATITSGLENAIADLTSSVDGYGQVNIRNSLSAPSASGDLVITADIGDDSSNFINIGINNSGFSTSSWTISGALDAYLYTSDSNLSIGVAAANKHLSFFVGDTLIENEKIRVTETGVGIGTTVAGSTLTVEGDARFSGIVTASRFESDSAGTPTIDSPNNLNINAITVAISTDVTIGDELRVAGVTTIGPNGINVTGGATFSGITTVTGEILFCKKLDISGITTHRDGISIRPLVGGNEYVSISSFGRMVLGSSIGTDAGIDIINTTTSASAEIFTISTPNVNLYDKKIIVDYGGRLLLGGNLDSSLNNAFTVLDNSGNISLTGYVSAGGTIGASGFIKSGGTSSQFLKADGSVDSNTYLTSYTETDTLNSVTNRGNSTSNGISVGVVTATTVNDSIGNVRDVPQNAQTSAYILAATDVGKHISITTGGVTVNSGIFSAGDAVSIYNNSSGNQTITQGGSVTMYLAGTGATGNRTLSARGVCTVLCVGSNTFVIFGAGLS
jgi:hypothetical protein